ncbi:hypothetical protein F5Y19DRAFT_458680 [Xylariaceae sp. FL1651]|nr:hypothetical protein F5Y19DRAFT_458680 [Xylariaceae sp. FL1651]
MLVGRSIAQILCVLYVCSNTIQDPAYPSPSPNVQRNKKKKKKNDKQMEALHAHRMLDILYVGYIGFRLSPVVDTPHSQPHKS